MLTNVIIAWIMFVTAVLLVVMCKNDLFERLLKESGIYRVNLLNVPNAHGRL